MEPVTKERGVVYCFSNGRLDREEELYHALAVAADGHVLAQAICSSPTWARVDLGVGDSQKKHDAYIGHYPNGFTVEWIDEPIGHEGLQEAQRLNTELAKKAAAAEVERMAAMVEKEEGENDESK